MNSVIRNSNLIETPQTSNTGRRKKKVYLTQGQIDKIYTVPKSWMPCCDFYGQV